MTTRRDFLVRSTAVGALAAFPAVARPAGPALIAGTYARLGSGGVYPLTPSADGWRVGDPDRALPDTSFGVSSPRYRYLLAETAKGRLRVTDHGGRMLADVASGGDDPCHAALDPQGRRLAIANYSSGTVAVYPLDGSGLPGTPVVRRHTGSGPNAARQAGPHAHWVGFTADGRTLYSVDLGADAVFAYDLGGAVASEPRVAWRAPAGSGPRHLARHPRLPVAYVVTELANTLETLSANRDGSFTGVSSQSLLPVDYSGESAAAHIAIDRLGRRLYVSNRGHDSIAVFALDAKGMATPIQHVACGGHWPRFFLLLEREQRLLVANERSGTVAALRLLPDGRLAPMSDTLAIPGVVFLDRA